MNEAEIADEDVRFAGNVTQNILDDFERFRLQCDEAEYTDTDTDDAWHHLNQLSAELRKLLHASAPVNPTQMPDENYRIELEAGLINEDGSQRSKADGTPYVAGLHADAMRLQQQDERLIDKFDPEYQREGTLGEVIDRRVQVYGDPVICFAEIAEMWSVYTGYEINPHQVAMMQLLMKVVRSRRSPDYSDHFDDIEGYLDIYRKVIGPDMIQARSVNEYIEKKWGGS